MSIVQSPPMQFEFATAARILFGIGTFREAGPVARTFGSRALVIARRATESREMLLERLRGQGMHVSTLAVSGEPTTDSVWLGVEQARRAECDVVIGLGGGSVLDTGKAIAAMLTNQGALLDYLEVAGKGHALSHPPAPFIAIPTTAGTGAEVTRNAVLASPEHKVKVSLRSPYLLPRLALVDPELTLSLPPAVTASTGLDSLTQLIEPYVSHSANPLADAFAREGMPLVARSLRRAFTEGNDIAARQDMALASLMGGLALANAKLGAAHGIASDIGGMFPAPHGVVCARLLPLVMQANVQALEIRAPQSTALARYTHIAQILTGDENTTVANGIAWLNALLTDLRIPNLGAFGLTPADLPAIVAPSQKASSTKGNPITLTDSEMMQILEQAV